MLYFTFLHCLDIKLSRVTTLKWLNSISMNIKSLSFIPCAIVPFVGTMALFLPKPQVATLAASHYRFPVTDAIPEIFAHFRWRVGTVRA